mmetsp:Transcript_13116/g.52315  ORF Transcript_13116/g.52315 Transcript_13116/m.52315 type:complete len:422 (+) Transcript_13116:111-1376(+)
MEAGTRIPSPCESENHAETDMELEEELPATVEELREVLRSCNEVYGEGAHSDTAEAMQALADALLEEEDEDIEGRRAEALQLNRKVAKMFAEICGPTHFNTVTAVRAVVDILADSDKLSDAIAEAEKLATAVESHETDFEAAAIARLILADMWELQGDTQTYMSCLHAAHRELQKADRPTLFLASVLYRLSRCYVEQDDQVKAITYQEQAVAAATEYYGAESAETALRIHTYADLLFNNGKEEAIPLFERALAIQKKINAATDELMHTYLGLARAYLWADEAAKAENLHAEAYTLAMGSGDGQVIATVLTDIGNYLLSAGAEEDSTAKKERGADMLLTAFPHVCEGQDREACLELAVTLHEGLPEEPARWLAVFDDVWEIVKDSWEDVCADASSAVTTDFLAAYATVKAAAQGRATKAAIE